MRTYTGLTVRHAWRQLASPLFVLALLAPASSAAGQLDENATDDTFSVTLIPRPVEHQSSGGRYRLTVETHIMESGELIFEDGFESGDTTAWNGATELPSGAVIFLASGSCPTGWSELIGGRGRIAFGLPVGGDLAGTLNPSFPDLYPAYHRHTVEILGETTTQPSHYHRWSDLGLDAAWTTFAPDNSTVTMFDWGNGIDSAGSGIYPFAAALDMHFQTSVAGSHSHILDVDTLTLSEDGGLPFIQLLGCVKN
jgi:hypothetical protein